MKPISFSAESLSRIIIDFGKTSSSFTNADLMTPSAASI